MTKKEKIVSFADFETIKRKNYKSETAHFFLLRKPNMLNIPRLGIIVSKKAGNAVKRNRIKRLIRVFFRLNKGSLQKVDHVFVAKNNIDKINYQQVEKELRKIICIK